MHPCDNADALLRALTPPRRNHYFYGKRMDVQHFQMEQDYGKLKRWLLNRLAVAPPHRNQGIGTALLTSAETRLRTMGHDRVALGVGIDNADAIRLYRRQGYRQWARPPIEARTGGDLGNGGGAGQQEIFTIFVKQLGAE